MPITDPSEWQRLVALRASLQAHLSGPDDPRIRVLRAELAWLDGHLKDTALHPEATSAYLLLIRTRLRLRLLEADLPEATQASEARQAFADALASANISRKCALEGLAAARQILGDALLSLSAILANYPDLGSIHVNSAADLVARSASYLDATSTHEVAVYSRVAAAYAAAARSESGAPETRVTAASELAAESLRWTQNAVERHEARRGEVASTVFEEVAWAVVHSFRAAAVSATPDLAEDATELFDTAAHAWMQLKSLTPPAEPEAAKIAREAHVVITTQLSNAISDLVWRAVKLLPSANSGQDDVDSLRSLRSCLHRLPAEMWHADTDADGVTKRVTSRDFAPESSLADLFDAIELRTVAMVVADALNWIPGDSSESPPPPELVYERDLPGLVRAVLYVRALDPPVRPGYLQAIVTGEDVLTLATTLAPDPDVAQSPTVDTDTADTAAHAPTAEELHERAQATSWRRTISVLLSQEHGWNWFERVTATLRDSDDIALGWDGDLAAIARGMWLILTTAAETFGATSRSAAQAVLDETDAARSRLRALGEEGPALEGVRASLLWAMGSDEPAVLRQVDAACRTALDYLDEGGSEYVVEILRANEPSLVWYRAKSALAEHDRLDSSPEHVAAASASLRSAIARLGPLEEPISHAGTLASDLRIHAHCLGLDIAPPTRADWIATVDLDPLQFLSYLLRFPGATNAVRGTDVVELAVERLLSVRAPLGAKHVPVLRALVVASGDGGALGLTATQRLAIARSALERLDPEDGQAAVGAMYIAVGLGDLAHDPVHAIQQSALMESFAERFLDRALADGHGSQPVVLFMLERAGAALNFGSVRAIERWSRERLAFAAHLLALSHDDLDLAAWSAIVIAELLRVSGAPQDAINWYAIYDEWIAKGALAGREFDDQRAAAAWDRAVLQRSLLVADGREAGTGVSHVRPDE